MKNAFWASLALGTCLTIASSGAQAQHTSKTAPCDVINSYNIPAQRFDETAQAIAHTTGCFVETDLAKTGAIRVKAVKGKMTRRQALVKAVEGTELEIVATNADKLIVRHKK